MNRDRPFKAYDGDQPYFFVTYSHANREEVESELTWIERAGYKLWCDEGIHVGSAWRQSIVDALENASGLIFMSTLEANESEHCRREIFFALEEKLPVIVVQLDDAQFSGELRLALSDRQALAKSAFAESEYRSRLVSALEGDLLESRDRRQSAAFLEEPSPRECIAVYPFDNGDGSDVTEYFSDGLTDELISTLAQVSELQVVSRTSVFAFKDKQVDVREFGKKLNATAVLEGSVRRAGDQIRVSAQLISVSDGFLMWSSKFDREYKNSFTIQDEISHAIVDALKLELGGSAMVKTPGSERAGEAYELFLKGRYHWHQQTADGLQQALNCYEASAEINPSFGPVHASISEAYASVAFHGIMPAIEALTKARVSARHALSINYTLPEANIAMAMVLLLLDTNWEESERYLRRAIELNPSSSTAYSFLAVGYSQRRNFSHGRIAIRKAIELDPLNIMNYTAAAWTEYYAGEPQTALKKIEEAISIDPNYPEVQVVMGAVQDQLGNHKEAIERISSVVEKYGPDPLVLAFLGAIHGRAGEQDDARKILTTMDEIAQTRYVPATCRALVYLGMEDPEMSIAELTLGVEQRDAFLGWINVLPFAQWLRADPRFNGILAGLGFATV